MDKEKEIISMMDKATDILEHVIKTQELMYERLKKIEIDLDSLIQDQKGK